MAASLSRSSRSLRWQPKLALLLLFLIALCGIADARGRRNFKPSDCRPRCVYRCSATSHKKPCMFYCLKCCTKCLCVPPGVFGNKQVCPCYNSWKTKEGRPKCP